MWVANWVSDIKESSISTLVTDFFTIDRKRQTHSTHALAKEWFEKIEAPEKAFFTFENSAHGTIMEEPEKFVQIIREITLNRSDRNIKFYKNEKSNSIYLFNQPCELGSSRCGHWART